MKVHFLVPSYRGLECLAMVDSLDAAMKLCTAKGYETALDILQGSCYVQVARNELVKRFREGGGDVAVFWDDDISLAAKDVLRLIETWDKEVVAAIYPYKTEREDYPVVIHCDEEGRSLVEGDCVEAAFVPFGMVVISRYVIEIMCEAYPERRYFKRENGEIKEGYYDLFPQGLRDGQWVGEDYAFCRLWTDLGGAIGVVADVDIVHHGAKAHKGNYHRFLCRQPGGSDAPAFSLKRAGEIDGWLSMQEGAWLAEQAAKHTRIVELGSCYGRSTRALADNTQGTVWAIDNWRGPLEANWSEAKRATVEAEFWANLVDLIEAGRVIPVTSDHGDLKRLDSIPDPDMVFIDGDHGLESVMRDIAYWVGRIAPGGLLCGHDSDWREVRLAVRELLPDAKTIPGTVIWEYEVPIKQPSNKENITWKVQPSLILTKP